MHLHAYICIHYNTINKKVKRENFCGSLEFIQILGKLLRIFASSVLKVLKKAIHIAQKDSSGKLLHFVKSLRKTQSFLILTRIAAKYLWVKAGAYKPPKAAKEHETRIPWQSKLRHRI